MWSGDSCCRRFTELRNRCGTGDKISAPHCPDHISTHLIKVLIVLLLCTFDVAVVESVKERQSGARCPLLLWDVVTLGFNYFLYFLHKSGHSILMHTYKRKLMGHIYTSDKVAYSDQVSGGYRNQYLPISFPSRNPLQHR